MAAGEWTTDRAQRDKLSIDAVMGALATRQHGVVARRQLLEAGLDRWIVARRVESGHLVVLHRGVYAVGHAELRVEGRWLAAVLAAGPGAALSHRAAAALHGLRPISGARIEVTTPARPRGAGIKLYARRALDAAELAIVKGIPTTTVARTLIDLAAMLPAHQLQAAVSEAERQGKLDASQLTQAPRALRTALPHAETFTRSELEDRFVALLDAQGLPRPLVNSRIEGMEVDACWPHARLVVELDGYAYHRSQRAFQRDRTKANDLHDAGYVVYRFTYEDVTRRPADVAARISRALAAAPRPRRSAPPAP